MTGRRLPKQHIRFHKLALYVFVTPMTWTANEVLAALGPVLNWRPRRLVPWTNRSIAMVTKGKATMLKHKHNQSVPMVAFCTSKPGDGGMA
jgi:hypothetical protein